MTYNEHTTVSTMAHLYGEPFEAYGMKMADRTLVVVKAGFNLTLLFEKPEALSGFLLAIAESPDAQQFLAQAGAGFSLTVEPLPQPEDEPTEAQLERLNNPDSGPSDSAYRAAMQDAGRGGLLRA